MNRFVNLQEIRRLDPLADAARIHRITMLKEFPFDWGLCLQLAFYRTYAIPRISRLLHRTGHIEADPVTRAEDTGLMMAEMLAHGLDHDRGKHVLRAMNRMHRRWDISNDDMLYVLGTFVIVPIRWLDRYGWRPVTPAERAAARNYYADMGRHMAMTGIPATYEAYVEWFDTYEAKNFAHTPSNRQLFLASQQLLVDRFSKSAAPLARQLGTALLDEPLRQALGVPRASWPLRTAVHHGFRLRARIVRWMPPRTEIAFDPGGKMRSHPNGYRLEDLGPQTATATESPARAR